MTQEQKARLAAIRAQVAVASTAEPPAPEPEVDDDEMLAGALDPKPKRTPTPADDADLVDNTKSTRPEHVPPPVDVEDPVRPYAGTKPPGYDDWLESRTPQELDAYMKSDRGRDLHPVDVGPNISASARSAPEKLADFVDEFDGMRTEYLGFRGGTDPDLYLPASGEDQDRAAQLWSAASLLLQATPGFTRENLSPESNDSLDRMERAANASRVGHSEEAYRRDRGDKSMTTNLHRGPAKTMNLHAGHIDGDGPGGMSFDPLWMPRTTLETAAALSFDPLLAAPRALKKHVIDPIGTQFRISAEAELAPNRATALKYVEAQKARVDQRLPAQSMEDWLQYDAQRQRDALDSTGFAR